MCQLQFDVACKWAYSSTACDRCESVTETGWKRGNKMIFFIMLLKIKINMGGRQLDCPHQHFIDGFM